MVEFQEITWVIFVSLALLTSQAASEETGQLLPRFVDSIPNVTVTVGRDAMLPCTVEQLKGYKVAWVQVDTQTILTIHKQVITRNPRISLLHNDHRTWHLQLKNVRESDRGWYMCQVNTDPMRYRQGYVDVVVPPDIIDRESTGDLTIREGQDVSLTCRAKGHPPPAIAWRREDGKEIVLDSEKIERGATNGIMGVPEMRDTPQNPVKEVKGEKLEMTKVSRLQMGSYLCIASNGVPPSISKRTHLRVQFPPVAWVPQQLEGAYIGQELTVECHTEAFPKSINYWTNTQGDMIVAGDRYEVTSAENTYKVYMKLRIKRVESTDFGLFSCIAKNSLGETDGAIKIYEIEAPKSHSNSVNGAEENEAESGDKPLSTDLTIKSGGKKFDTYLHPHGINDISDHHRHSKPHDNTGQGQRSTAHHGSRPGYGSPFDHTSTSAGGASPYQLLTAALLTCAVALTIAVPVVVTSQY